MKKILHLSAFGGHPAQDDRRRARRGCYVCL